MEPPTAASLSPSMIGDVGRDVDIHDFLLNFVIDLTGD
jgi:hypothetical protein